LSTADPKAFSKRLSIALNSHYLTNILRNYYIDNSTLALYDNATLPVRDLDVFLKSPRPPVTSLDEFLHFYNTTGITINRAEYDGLPYIPTATTGTSMVRTAIFVCQFHWLAVLLLAAAALCLMGVALLALQLRCTLALDMLRYVTSMIDASPYFGTPPGGMVLEGMARTRLLRDVRVRIGDVSGSCNVGVLAIVATNEIEARELDKQRLYS
jgi:hypothetical protein